MSGILTTVPNKETFSLYHSVFVVDDLNKYSLKVTAPIFLKPAAGKVTIEFCSVFVTSPVARSEVKPSMLDLNIQPSADLSVAWLNDKEVRSKRYPAFGEKVNSLYSDKSMVVAVFQLLLLKLVEDATHKVPTLVKGLNEALAGCALMLLLLLGQLPNNKVLKLYVPNWARACVLLIKMKKADRYIKILFPAGILLTGFSSSNC